MAFSKKSKFFGTGGGSTVKIYQYKYLKNIHTIKDFEEEGNTTIKCPFIKPNILIKLPIFIFCLLLLYNFHYICM